MASVSGDENAFFCRLMFSGKDDLEKVQLENFKYINLSYI